VAECGGLENRYAFTGIEGSNPSLSAMRTKYETRNTKYEMINIKSFVFCASYFVFL
jgi:hypothetical protein